MTYSVTDFGARSVVGSSGRTWRKDAGQFGLYEEPRREQSSVEQPIPRRQPELDIVIVETLGVPAHLSDDISEGAAKLCSARPELINVIVDFLRSRCVVDNADHEIHPRPRGQQEIDHGGVRHFLRVEQAEIVTKTLHRAASDEGFSDPRSIWYGRKRPGMACDRPIELGRVDQHELCAGDALSLRGLRRASCRSQRCDNCSERHHGADGFPFHDCSEGLERPPKAHNPAAYIGPHLATPSTRESFIERWSPSPSGQPGNTLGDTGGAT